MTSVDRQGESPRAGNIHARGGHTRTLKRITRLLRLAGELDRSGSGVSESLHDMLGISRRTLYRDLALLKEAGLPVANLRHQVQRIDPSRSTAYRHAFSIKEKAALLTFLRSRKQPSRGSSYATHLRDCLIKLGSLFKNEGADGDAVEACIVEFLSEST